MNSMSLPSPALPIFLMGSPTCDRKSRSRAFCKHNGTCLCPILVQRLLVKARPFAAPFWQITLPCLNGHKRRDICQPIRRYCAVPRLTVHGFVPDDIMFLASLKVSKECRAENLQSVVWLTFWGGPNHETFIEPQQKP